ncbi:MAG: DUF481 domain-containing protein [Bacteroidota bacterium]
MKTNILLINVFVLVSFSLFGQNDTIVLSNGNVLVGEIKGMDRGILKMETPYSDSDFSIEWGKVVKINTESHFVVSIEKGRIYGSKKKDSAAKREKGGRYSSSLIPDENDPAKVKIKTDEGYISVDIKDIVFLRSFEDSFFSRLSAKVDFGYTITKAKNLRQFSAQSLLSYVTDDWSSEFSMNLVNNTQDSVSDVRRNEYNITFNYFLPHDFFLTTEGNFLQNDEQKLQLRSTIKGGLGYFFVKSNDTYFNTKIGLAFNNEEFTDPEIGVRQSAEAYLSLEWSLFDLDNLDLLTNIAVYPSLSEKGRVRTDFKIDIKYDLPKDFYIRAGTSVNYDNQPIEGASDYDYVVQTGFGWEWN